MTTSFNAWRFALSRSTICSLAAFRWTFETFAMFLLYLRPAASALLAPMPSAGPMLDERLW